MLEQIAEAMLAARAMLLEQFNKLHKAVLKIARRDEACRRFMTTPSVGAIVAITYKSALDDPGRIKKSRDAGPLFGLTPKRRVKLTLPAESRALATRWFAQPFMRRRMSCSHGSHASRHSSAGG